MDIVFFCYMVSYMMLFLVLFVVRSCLSVILLSNLPAPGGHCESGFPDCLPSRTKQHTGKVKPKYRKIK